jgi:hypothetical protein
MSKDKGTKKVGRDAGSGKFMPVKDAKANKGSAIVQTVKAGGGKKKDKKKK